MCKLNVPILFICFCRLDYVEKTLPLLLNKDKVYICSDGYNNELEKRGVTEVREYINSLKSDNIIIWERDKNYGCEQNIIDSFNWITSLEKEFIVCEEDVVLKPEFFDFIEANKDRIGLDKEYQFISRCLYNSTEKDGNYFFNSHGWYTKTECFNYYFKDILKYSKQEFLETICKYIYKPSKDSYKAVMSTLLQRQFYWDEALKYSIFFNKGNILYSPNDYSTHIGKISSNQHGFIWLEDGTFVRNN